MPQKLHRSVVIPALLIAAAAAAHAQPPAAGVASEPLDWRALEAPLLRGHRQLTSRDEFLKAGEAYFSPDARWIIFQATPAPKEGEQSDPFYAMYAAELVFDETGGGGIIGMKPPIRLSEPGTANTCGHFHPTMWEAGTGYAFIFGTTVQRPADEQRSGFQVEQRDYRWMFPNEMEIVAGMLRSVGEAGGGGGGGGGWEAQVDGPLFRRPGYDAEGAHSPDGRFIVYTRVVDAAADSQEDNAPPVADPDIWILDTLTQKHYPIIVAEGYDGGPFFSPCGKYICYRSDRRGDRRLQLFVAELKFDDQGVPVGITQEHQLTDDSHVHWAPYWHPSGEYLVYASSAMGHHNYEVFAIEVALDPARTPAERQRVRITHADGADVLPVFSPDGRWMMWTAQRGPLAEGETRASSQLWIAEVVPGGLDQPAKLFGR